MSVENEIAKAERFRTFAKETFTFLEWLTISAAIHWAAVKTSASSLAILSFGLQLIAVIYVMLTGAIYFRSHVQRIALPFIRWLLAIPLVLALFIFGNWLVTTTVNRLVATQLSDVSPSGRGTEESRAN